jgi:hypothetical protein
MNATFESSEAAILDRVFRPDAGGWSRAAAEAILNVGFGQSDRNFHFTSMTSSPKNTGVRLILQT